MELKQNEIVVFSENHKWVGTIGYIEEIKESKYLIAIPDPTQRVVFIFIKKEDAENDLIPTGAIYPFDRVAEDE